MLISMLIAAQQSAMWREELWSGEMSAEMSLERLVQALESQENKSLNSDTTLFHFQCSIFVQRKMKNAL